jgi:hypothetical protein
LPEKYRPKGLTAAGAYAMMGLLNGAATPPKAKAKVILMATITPKELSVKLGLSASSADAKVVRRFLRSKDGLNMKVGKGHRWAIEGKDVRGLKSRFAAWQKAEAEARAGRLAKAAEEASEAAEAIEIGPGEAEAPEALAIEEGPTEADLLAIEAGDEEG